MQHLLRHRFAFLSLALCSLLVSAPATAEPQAAPGASPGASEDTSAAEEPQPLMDIERDLLSLHYDHAPDKDDGHSAAADLTLLQTLYGEEWIDQHVVPVSGAYGTNKRSFNSASDAVMDATFGEEGWIAADEDWDAAVATLAERWMQTLENGGDIYVKEGGQSDITADVVRVIQEKMPDLAVNERVHVVQHSNWNEKHTSKDDLAFTQEVTNYIRIEDANRYLNIKGGDDVFEKAAREHPQFGQAWQAAFEYYNPDRRLDFSDTGELMHILGLGEMSVDDFRTRFLEAN